MIGQMNSQFMLISLYMFTILRNSSSLHKPSFLQNKFSVLLRKNARKYRNIDEKKWLFQNCITKNPPINQNSISIKQSRHILMLNENPNNSIIQFVRETSVEEDSCRPAAQLLSRNNYLSLPQPVLTTVITQTPTFARVS